MNTNYRTQLNSTMTRKPLTNLTNIPSAEITKQKVQLSRPSSTKALRNRISIDEQSRLKLKQVVCRRKSNSNSLEAGRENVKQNFCKHHKNRIAMYQIDEEKAQYFCLECFLVYVKQGYKMKAIQSSADNEKAKRQKQTSQYLQKCKTVESELMNWRKQQNKTIKQIYDQFKKRIDDEKQKMEVQLNKIQDIYGSFIKNLEEIREERIRSFRETGTQIQKISKAIEIAKLDIQKNYDDCIKTFTSYQFKSAMDNYWKQIRNAQEFLMENSIRNITRNSGMDAKVSMTTMERSGNLVSEFTFSKENKFETPPFSKHIRGIKFVQSKPDSNRYSSSIQESIVDSKINFNQFQI